MLPPIPPSAPSVPLPGLEAVRFDRCSGAKPQLGEVRELTSLHRLLPIHSCEEVQRLCYTIKNSTYGSIRFPGRRNPIPPRTSIEPISTITAGFSIASPSRESHDPTRGYLPHRRKFVNRAIFENVYANAFSIFSRFGQCDVQVSSRSSYVWRSCRKSRQAVSWLFTLMNPLTCSTANSYRKGRPQRVSTVRPTRACVRAFPSWS